jgi:hypothetical protein
MGLPSDKGRIGQAGLGLQQCDALPIQHRSFFRYKSGRRKGRSQRLVRQVDQFSDDRLIDTASYLLFAEYLSVIKRPKLHDKSRP